MGKKSSNHKCLAGGCCITGFGIFCTYGIISPDFLLNVINTFSQAELDKTSLTVEEVWNTIALAVGSYLIGPTMIYISRSSKLLKSVFS